MIKGFEERVVCEEKASIPVEGFIIEGEKIQKKEKENNIMMS